MIQVIFILKGKVGFLVNKIVFFMLMLYSFIAVILNVDLVLFVTLITQNAISLYLFIFCL